MDEPSREGDPKVAGVRGRHLLSARRHIATRHARVTRIELQSTITQPSCMSELLSVGRLIQPPGLMLHAGDQAPDFTATLDDGTSFTLSEQRGRVIVLFFYPKDDTPG